MTSSKKRIIVLLGLPGSGKGTQADNLVKMTALPVISVGALAREQLATHNFDDPFVAKIKSWYDQGIPQPDEVAFELIRRKLSLLEGGVILDGFPLSLPQADFLEKLVTENGWEAPALVYLKIKPETAVRRIVFRKICSKCGSVYTADEDETCEKCGGLLTVRADDNEKTVKKRIDQYLPRINAVLERFSDFGKVIEIDGEPSPEIVWQSIIKEITKTTT